MENRAVSRPSWAPAVVHAGDAVSSVGRGKMQGATCHFDGIAPITGDAIYKGARSDSSIVLMLVTCPDARENQRRTLLRGKTRIVSSADKPGPQVNSRTERKARRKEQRAARVAQIEARWAWENL